MKKLLAIVVLGLLWNGNVYAANFKAHVKNYFDTSKSYYGFSKKDFKEAKKQAFDDCKASSVEKQIDSSGCLLYALQSSSALRALTNKEYEEVFWDKEVAKYMQRKATDYDRWLNGMGRMHSTFGKFMLDSPGITAAKL